MEATQSSALLVSQVFNNYAVGIGALLAGIGGLKVLFDWARNTSEKKRRERLTVELKAKYPSKENGNTFQLIESSAKPGMIYLLDKKTNKKHHIASLSTFIALGYDHSMVQRLGQDVFNSIEEGDEFLTEGERFS